MKISTKGRYGMKAMIDIAVFSEGNYIPLKAIAERQNISDTYLEQIISSLKKSGLLLSARGKTGGYKLARHAKKIKASHILQALEGSYAPVDCVHDDYEASMNCHFCSSKKVWEKLYEAMNCVLEEISLADLAEDMKINIVKEREMKIIHEK